MAMRLGRHAVFALLLLAASAVSAGGGETATSPPDPRGRPDEKLIDQPQRYYVWHDVDGWHLRTAAKGMTKFEGSVRVVGGRFRKFRRIGLEGKGKFADRWSLDEKREVFRFQIYTSTSFDGLDFDVAGDATGIEFDLSIAGAKRPRRIFVGKTAGHPAEATFTLPLDDDGGPRRESRPAE